MLRFDDATDVIDAGSDRVLQNLGAGRRQWVLWPVLAWKVLIPEPRPRTFDVFQAAILRLCRAGLVRAEEIGKRLALHADLVAFVILQLQGIGFLDSQGRPSARALRLLSHDDEPEVTDAVGYVFEDALARRLWPRFWTGKLPYAKVERSQHGNHLVIERGTVGDPRPEPVWPIAAQIYGAVPPPAALAILRAARQHRRRVTSFHLEQGKLGEAARDAPPGGPPSELLIDRVRLVDREPEPIFVAVCAFVPKESRDARAQVADPFGLGANAELRAELNRRAQLGERTPQMTLARLEGDAVEVDSRELVELVRAESSQANQRVRGRLGAGIEEVPPLAVQHLAAAEERLAAARHRLTGTHRDRSSGLKQLDDSLGFVYATVEEIFGWLVRTFCVTDDIAALTANARNNRPLLEEIARRVGFHVDDSGDLGLMTVTCGQVRGAIEFENRALPARLAASLLAAHRRAEHPLHRLAASFPQAIASLSRLKRLRDRASHASDIESQLPAAEAALGDVYRVLQALVPAAPSDRHLAELEAGKVVEWTAELVARLRMRAARLVAERAPEVIELSELRVRLVDTQQKALELALLAAGGAEPALIASRLRDFAVAAGLVVETGLARVTRASRGSATVRAVPADKKHLAREVARAAEASGFQLDAGALPGDLAFVRPEAVRRALAGADETQNARLAALLLSAAVDEDHPLRHLAALHRELLRDCARIAEARGHGDEAHMGTEELDDLMATTYRLARTFTIAC